MEAGSHGLEIWVAGRLRMSWRRAGEAFRFDAAYIRYNWVGHGTGTCMRAGRFVGHEYLVVLCIVCAYIKISDSPVRCYCMFNSGQNMLERIRQHRQTI